MAGDTSAESSLATIAYERLGEALRRGDYPVGKRLVEGDLARTMGISRTPVHEALRRLEEDGLVQAAASRGYVVADMMADAEHVFLIRERLEGLAAVLAAQQITMPELERLQEFQRQMEQMVDSGPVDLDRLVELNAAFHSLIVSASRAPRLERLIERLHPAYLSHEVVRSYDSDGRIRSINEHRAIFQALWRREPDVVDALVQAHLEHGKEVVLQQIKGADVTEGGSK